MKTLLATVFALAVVLTSDGADAANVGVVWQGRVGFRRGVELLVAAEGPSSTAPSPLLGGLAFGLNVNVIDAGTIMPALSGAAIGSLAGDVSVAASAGWLLPAKLSIDGTVGASFPADGIRAGQLEILILRAMTPRFGLFGQVALDEVTALDCALQAPRIGAGGTLDLGHGFQFEVASNTGLDGDVRNVSVTGTFTMLVGVR